MSRVIALVVAAGLIVGAIAVRSAIDRDPGRSERTGVVRVVCAEELAAACGTLAPLRYQVVSEEAAITAERLAKDAAVDFDVWVVEEPWPGMVDDARTRAGLEPLFAHAKPPVARSPLVAVGPSSLKDCNWRCLGDRAPKDLRVGSRRLTTGVGTLELGAAAAGYLGRSDFASNDLDTTFDAWIGGFAGAVQVSNDPVIRLLQSPAFFDVALSYEADATLLLHQATADRKAGLDLLYPAPVAYVDVAVVDIGGALATRAGDVPSSLATALLQQGWQAPAATPNGLPRAGVLVALRSRVA